MAIEVSGVRAGGLDPVLHIGEQVVRDYVYVRPGVARFVADVVTGAAPSVSFDAGAAR
jgi:hypothetical protein